MSIPIPSDVIRLISLYLSPLDIVRVGMTCKALAERILHGATVEVLWRQYVSNCLVSDVPVRGVIGGAFFWQRIAFEKRDVVRLILQEHHLVHRFAQPQSSKDFLCFYVRIDTTGRKPVRDLLGNIVPNQYEEVKLPSVLLTQEVFGFDLETSLNVMKPGWLTLNFYPAIQRQKLLWWEHESMFHSNIKIYAVDRQRTPPTIEIYGVDRQRTPPKYEQGVLQRMALSIEYLNREDLTRSLCREAGKLAHNDENYFFTDGNGPSYNYRSDHGNFRNMGQHDSRYGIGSISGTGRGGKPRIRDFLGVHSFEGVQVCMELKQLYELFCRV